MRLQKIKPRLNPKMKLLLQSENHTPALRVVTDLVVPGYYYGTLYISFLPEVGGVNPGRGRKYTNQLTNIKDNCL